MAGQRTSRRKAARARRGRIDSYTVAVLLLIVLPLFLMGSCGFLGAADLLLSPDPGLDAHDTWLADYIGRIALGWGLLMSILGLWALARLRRHIRLKAEDRADYTQAF